jgi:hypothetical protein
MFTALFQEMFFTLPVMRDGVLLDHEQVVKLLDADTVSQSNAVGVDGSSNFSAGSFGQLVMMQLKVEVKL